MKLCFVKEMTPAEFADFCLHTMNGVVSQDAGNGNLNVWIYA